jgi:hypothetical protein
LKEVEFSKNRLCLIKIHVNTTILGPPTQVPSDEGSQHSRFVVIDNCGVISSFPQPNTLTAILWYHIVDTISSGEDGQESMDISFREKHQHFKGDVRVVQ